MYEEIETMGRKVGVVLDIEGQRLMYARKYPNGRIGTFQACKGTQVYINDHLKTDKFTKATLEFDIGGQTLISPDTEIVILGQRDVRQVGNQFIITARKLYMKADGSQGKRQVQIPIAGGSIEG